MMAPATRSEIAVVRASRPTERFHALDVLRGLAALGVVLFHWQNFFFGRAVQEEMLGTALVGAGSITAEQLPLGALFGFLYRSGWLLVDLFFSLSGFVFFWLYAERIAARQVALKEFALLRFSRLYPLHLATLVAAIVGFAVLTWQGGHPFTFAHNGPLDLL